MAHNDPNFDAQVAQLVRYYKRAIRDLQAELNRLSLTDMQRAHIAATLKSVSDILAQLNDDSRKWVEENVTAAARLAVEQTILALGVVETLAEAEKIASFNRANQAAVKAAVDDTMADLLAVTDNVNKRVRGAVRKASAEVIRGNMAKGINGRRTISREILAQMQTELGKAVDTGIIDAIGRRWRPDVYVDMVAHTKMSQIYRDATINESAQRGAYYGVVSAHGAKDGCGKWEGQIVKLVADAPGPYTYVGDIPNRELFHPKCRHHITPLRDPEKYNG